MTGRPSKRDWARQLQAAALARDARPADATRMGAVVPSVKIDRDRITLPGLRFMGEEPHPSQLAIVEDKA